MNLIGTVLAGRYEIVEEIGSGGMAIVYKAKCRILNRFVAIKVLRTDLKDDGEFLRRFNVEAQSAASLTHPNIVSIYDVGTEGDLHYIVMEYVEGITLKEYIDKNTLLYWHEAVDFAVQIASGLEQAHKNSIVHRDIKPHNIIMTRDGVLKITDFGIARASMQSTVTCEDTAIGSVHYVSPEQARGGYVDERSDIYSLGIVLYEMLTGKVPFDNESPVSIALMHLQSQPTPPREFNLSIPKNIEDIVLKALSKELAGRYKTVTDFKNDLIAATGTAPVVPNVVEEEPLKDNLGGTAIFTAVQDVPSYRNNQAPSASSNLTVPPVTEHSSAPDIELYTDDEDIDEYKEESPLPNNKRTKKQKNNSVNLAVIFAALLASALIIWGIIYVASPIISDLFSSSENQIKKPDIDEKLPTDITQKEDDTKADDEKDDNNEDENFEPLENYVGKKLSDVEDELERKYGSIVVKKESSSTVPKGQIISQSVLPGSSLKSGQKLVITVSSGEETDEGNEDKNKTDNENNKDENSNKNDNSTTTQQTYRKRITVYGPTDKESALVEVKVNGKIIKSTTLAKNASDVVTIQSSHSSVTAEIYHDGQLIHSQTIDMTK